MEPVFQNEKEFAQATVEKGGRLYRVGGSIRDELRGIKPKDDDYCVTGFSNQTFLNAFPSAHQVLDKNGEKTVDVFLLKVNGKTVEVALARTETMVEDSNEGYHAFEFHADEDITIEMDLYRRDMTINSIAKDLLTGEYIDPYGGIQDIKDKVIRATSDAFYEDPTRVYRVAVRYAIDEGYEVEERTKVMMKKASRKLDKVAINRVVNELEKALLSPRPDKFFRLLQEVDVLDIHYPWVNNLVGVIQPEEHHPEGDAFEHTMRTLLSMRKQSEKAEEIFSMLTHDFGKYLTPLEKRPAHHGHEKAGVPLVNEMCNALKLPRSWRRAALFATEYHGKFHALGEMRIGKVVDLLVKAERTPLKIEGFARVGLADTRGKKDPNAKHPNTKFALLAKEELLKAKPNLSLKGRAVGEDMRRQQIGDVKKLKKQLIETNELKA